MSSSHERANFAFAGLSGSAVLVILLALDVGRGLDPELGLDADHCRHHLLDQVAETFRRSAREGGLGDGRRRMVEGGEGRQRRCAKEPGNRQGGNGPPARGGKELAHSCVPWWG